MGFAKKNKGSSQNFFWHFLGLCPEWGGGFWDSKTSQNVFLALKLTFLSEIYKESPNCPEGGGAPFQDRVLEKYKFSFLGAS